MLSSARIRHFKPSDEKLVLFAIGKANMEALAVANKKACFHPVVISTWLALSAVLIDYMNWWPSLMPGWLGYLRSLPAFASMAVPIMFLIDWINRPYFEKATQDVIRNGDLRSISEYYSEKSASGFWILEYGDKFVGLIALDASAETAVIRHFYVDEMYRPANIQDDLLKHAVDNAFTRDPSLEGIECHYSPLVPYLGACLRNAGFRLDHYTESVGVCRWKLGKGYLEKKDWKMGE